MRLPLEVADARERLKVLNQKREKIIHSTIAAMNFTLVPLVGALPHPVLNFFAHRSATTIMMSNFPGELFTKALLYDLNIFVLKSCICDSQFHQMI